MGKKRKKKSPVKSKIKMSYHGREGYPMIHFTAKGRKYIMVRAKGGGRKRLYLKAGNVPKKHRGKKK